MPDFYLFITLKVLDSPWRRRIGEMPSLGAPAVDAKSRRTCCSGTHSGRTCNSPIGASRPAPAGFPHAEVNP